MKASTGFFVVEVFLCEQLLDVLKGFGIHKSERVGWYIELERKCISPWRWMQFSGCELHVEKLMHTEKVLRRQGPCCNFLLFHSL